MGLKNLSSGKKVFVYSLIGLIVLAILSALLGARAFFMFLLGVILVMVSLIPKVMYQRKMKETPVMYIFTVAGVSLVILAAATALFAKSNPGILVTMGMYFFSIVWIVFGAALIIKAKGNKKMVDLAEDMDHLIEEKSKETDIVVEPVTVEEQQQPKKGGSLLVVLGIICIFTGIIAITLINTLLGNINGL